MTWIKFLINKQTKYYIHKIEKQDSIILRENNNIIVILSGISYIAEIFVNKEISPVGVLSKNDIFTISNNKRKIIYQITALEKTYILKLNKNILKQKKSQILIYKNISNYYIKTFENYQIVNTIMKQKHITNRVTQLFLVLCIKFGKIKGNDIFIPFQLSYKNIAILTGTSENTITKIMNKIYKSGIISKIYKNIIVIHNVINLNI